MSFYQRIKLGDHFSFDGGSFRLSDKTLNRAVGITKIKLDRDLKRLALFRKRPGNPTFAYDTKWHGTRIIDHLLNAHVKFERERLDELLSLKQGGQMLLERAS